MISIEGDNPPPEPDPEPDEPKSGGEARDDEDGLKPVDGQLVLVLIAFIAIVVAIGAIGATLFRAAFNTEEPAPTNTAASVTGATSAVEPILPGAVTIDDPLLGEVARYDQDGAIVYFHATGEFCGRGEGTLGASGVITNASWPQRTYDYVIAVELIRAWNRSPIGLLESTVEGLSSGQSAEWSVELGSSRVSTIVCEVKTLTVVPTGG